MPIVLKSGCLILLEPSGPVQTCNGIALPLPFKYSGPTVAFLTVRATVTNNWGCSVDGRRTVAGCCEYCNELPVDTKRPGNF